jgi:hypothetical protein
LILFALAGLHIFLHRVSVVQKIKG